MMGCQTAINGRQRPLLASVDGGRGNPVPELAAAAGPEYGAGHRPAPAGASRDDRPGRWLAAAMVSLAVLAAGAAVVSFAAQYRMVLAAKGSVPVAGLEAGIPDVAALIFATLGIALALHGKRAIRARVLNVAAVGTSVLMNALAAAPGWRAAAIWVMPPVAYAIASDTLIGVVRAHAIARHKALQAALAEDDATPLAIVGGLLLWLLRLAVAPASTLGGFRAWVVEECPVAPGRRAHPGVSPGPGRAPVTTAGTTALPASPARTSRAEQGSGGTKTSRFLALVADRHGPLEAFPIGEVSKVSAELAPEVGLHPGAARAALRRRVRALQNGSEQ